jgi:hypothetical protein
LSSIYKGDAKDVIADARFDPSGRYASYDFMYQDANYTWQLEFHVIDLDSGATSVIPVAHVESFPGAGYEWTGNGHLLVTSPGEATLYTYLPDGTQIGSEPLPPSTSVQASANGATLLFLKYAANGEFANAKLVRGNATYPLTFPIDQVRAVTVSPDGTQVFVSGFSETDNGEAGYLADVPSP